MENIDLEKLSVQDLKRFLRDRGITAWDYKKAQLVELGQTALKLNLPCSNLGNNDQSVSVINSGGTPLDQNTPGCVEPQNWTKNLTEIPDVEQADVLVYLLGKGWEQEKLRSYKNSHGYRLYKDGHVHDVMMSKCPQHIHLRSKCVRETSLSEKPYQIWTLLQERGTIISCGCECPANDGICKHVVALLFSINCWCDRHRDRHSQVGTDITCEWSQPRIVSRPLKLDEIPYYKAKTLTGPVPGIYFPGPRFESREVEKAIYRLVKRDDTNIIEGLIPPSDDSDDETELHVPTMTDLVREYKFSLDIQKTNFFSFLSGKFTAKDCKLLEECTRGQSANDNWFHHRKGRICASQFSSVLSFKGDTPNTILKQVMGNCQEIHVPAMAYGKENEPVACQLYIDRMVKNHKLLKVKSNGLIVNKEYFFLGATPDGLVSCKCCGDGLLEIKCTYKFQNCSIDNVLEDQKYHLFRDEIGGLHLKQSSSWYKQIQGQLAVTRKAWCDFVLFTGCSVENNLFIERIYPDVNFSKNALPKLACFFEKYVIPKLLSQVERES